MLGWVTDAGGPAPPGWTRVSARVSPRKLRLFACGSCRLVWSLLADPRSRRAVEVTEGMADGRRPDAWPALWEESWDAAYALLQSGGADSPAYLAARHACMLMATDPSPPAWWQLSCTVPGADQAGLLRDVAGNPFRPVPCMKKGPHAHPANQEVDHGVEGWRWVSPTVLALAISAYEDRKCHPCGRCKGPLMFQEGKYCGRNDAGDLESCPACNGTGHTSDGLLDPVRLSILADALEDAGCENADVLGHLRSPGPHVRGCWPLDLILGKD
jgi:hypothetical protein